MTGSWPAALPAQIDVKVGRGVILRFGLSLGFGGGIGTRSGIRVWGGVRTRVRVRTGIGGRIRTGGCWGRGNVASSFVPLHVPHTSDGLDLRHRGSPVVPVFEITMFKDILAPPVAWIHISNPPAKREREREKITGSDDLFFVCMILAVGQEECKGRKNTSKVHQ